MTRTNKNPMEAISLASLVRCWSHWTRRWIVGSHRYEGFVSLTIDTDQAEQLRPTQTATNHHQPLHFYCVPIRCSAMQCHGCFFFFLFIFGFLNGPSIAKRVNCFLIDCRRPSISAALRESDPELYRFYEIKTIKANGTRRNW